MKTDPIGSSDAAAPAGGLAARFSNWCARHPVTAIALVSLLVVILNCYPVIFCGKSFVSPVTVNGALVYDWWPPLPGMAAASPVSQHDSDTGAMMWWGVPMGFVESRSILEHGELPLWNRYSHSGDTLIGQTETMLGDPLQLFVIFGRGSAAAWDVKFLVAKFLFCFGFGWLVLRLLGNSHLALLYAALAAYCGAFIFVDNHMMFFVLAYAPWILLSAIKLLDLQSDRHFRWGIIWLLANFACFNAGHLELAVDLIGGLNLAALAYALAQGGGISAQVKLLGRLVFWTLLFFGLTAPVWLSFLVALSGSNTAHDKVAVMQLPLARLPGAFEDIFYHLRNDYYDTRSPGSSLLILVGCLLSAVRWKHLKTECFFWVNTGAVVLWGGFVFGWIPDFLIAVIPFLNRVGHIQLDFSFLLVIHLTLQSAYGFKSLEKNESWRRAVWDFIWVGLIVEGLVFVYFYENKYAWFNDYYMYLAGAGALGASLLFKYFKSQGRQISALGWTTILVLGFIPNGRFGLYNFGPPELMMLPGPRAVLDASSPAIAKIKTQETNPFRVAGLGSILIGDYSATYALEGIGSCAPLMNREYIKLIGHFPGIRLTEDWVIQIIDPIKVQPLLNLLNVKYLLANPSAKIPEGLDFRVSDRSDFLVLSNAMAWPRAFFSNRIIPISSNEEFIQQLLKNPDRPFIAITLEEIKKQPDFQIMEVVAGDVLPATNYRLLPNSTAFDIHASSAGMVCLTEEQAQDFSAKANNQPKPILTVNRAFKGIYLEAPGDYHIEFTYRPRHWRLACGLFWSSTILVLMLTMWEIIRTRNRQKIAIT